MSQATYSVVRAEGDPRRAHFEYFCSLANPYVGLTVDVDIARLDRFRRAQGAPFFLTLLYCASRAANAVPQLRERIRGDEILRYDWCPSSHTEARPDGTYGYCTLWANRPLEAFLREARVAQAAARASQGLEEDEDPLPCLFVSSLPWLRYSALVQPTPVPADSNPRISWGRATAEGDRLLLPLSLLCNHALADGLHIARFYEAFEAEIAAL